MTDTRYTPPESAGGSTMRTQSGWTGWVVFAGVVMLLVGVIQAVHGLAALFKDDYFAVTQNGLAIAVDLTTWGWFHLVLGLVLLGAGFCVMIGQWWARAVGVVVAGLSLLVNFASLAAYPVAAVVMIVIDLLVIYALVVHGREMKPDYANY